jgi:hypothetical protein
MKDSIENKEVVAKVFFQFDNDEPVEFADLVGHSKFLMELEYDKTSPEQSGKISFQTKEGKKFTLYVTGVDEELIK